MPIRIVCPSCSAALSIEDELAGRAVKCPTCGSVIPPSAQTNAPAPASPPPSSSLDAAFEFGDVAKSGGSNEPMLAGDFAEEVSDQPPPRKAPQRAEPVRATGDRDREPDRGDRGDRGDRRDRGDRDDRRERRDRRDDDRPPRARRADDRDAPPPRESSGTGLVLAIFAVLGLLCCGGIGVGVYFVVEAVKKFEEDREERRRAEQTKPTRTNYDALTVGTTTRAQADEKIIGGRLATEADLPKVFFRDPQRTKLWVEKVNENRVVVWQDGDNYIIAAFYPDANGRLQAKEWRPRIGTTAQTGELDDEKFVKAFPGKDDGPTDAIEVTAEELAKAYQENEAAAD
ncbi:MAG: zinc-ribbon domain-containing protein, partial [Planctomycetia bacterium]|nr:zinc-ribbon domain-containing protein [Planctomycetia bacterium]